MKPILMLFVLAFSLQSYAIKKNDVTVPVPPSLIKTVTLKIVGQAGPEQAKQEVRVFQIKFDAKNNPIKKSRIFLGVIDLNQEAKLYPGEYELNYGLTSLYRRYEASANEVIKLRKINVPDSGAKITFKVFVDYKEQDNKYFVAQTLWATNHDYFCSLVKGDEKPVTMLAKNLCENYEKENFENFLASVLENSFNEQGQVRAFYHNGEMAKYEYNYITDDSFKEGGYALVLPGVYGIIFTDTEGRETIQHGILVK